MKEQSTSQKMNAVIRMAAGYPIVAAPAPKPKPKPGVAGAGVGGDLTPTPSNDNAAMNAAIRAAFFGR